MVLDFSGKTKVMGILNVTPDSFSDGGRFNDVGSAVEQATRMIAEGADIIDVGGESSRPGAKEVSASEEWMRVKPVLEEIKELGVPISIDSYKPEVAEKALDLGASIVNDISGLRNEKMMELVSERGCPVALMHMKGTPRNMQENPTYGDVVSEIKSFFSERIKSAEDAGIQRKNIILDPGIGFGKTVKHNFEIIKRLDEFKELGCPILLGPSRKSFIGEVLDLPADERLEGTLAVLAVAVEKGVDIVRVHDVAESVRSVRMTEAILEGIRYEKK
ncbi:MAG: dihydropteroate synthase [Candidatus Altiarchaeota archaeon]